MVKFCPCQLLLAKLFQFISEKNDFLAIFDDFRFSEISPTSLGSLPPRHFVIRKILLTGARLDLPPTSDQVHFSYGVWEHG